MKPLSAKQNWLVDAILLGGFLTAFFLDLTGLAWHQWLGLAVGLLCVYHGLVHWTWIKTVTCRFFQPRCGRARLYYLIDAGLFGGLGLILVSGLVISTWLALPLAYYEVWRVLHITTSVVTLLLLVLKIGLHWRWIVTVGRRCLRVPSTPVQGLQPAPGAIGRREFLQLMGVVGVASALALTGALKALRSAELVDEEQVLAGAPPAPGKPQAAPVTPAARPEGWPTPTGQPTAVSTPTPLSQPTVASTPTSVPASPTAACVVRCPRGCSYPGHCRRYTDANGNGRCDWGECL